MKKIKCAICGKEITITEGNNPYPVRPWSAINSDKNRCCHECNEMYVIPFRFAIAGKNEKEKQQVHTMLKFCTQEKLIELREAIVNKQ